MLWIANKKESVELNAVCKKVMTSVSLNMAFCQDFYKCLNWYVDLQLNKIVFSTVLNINPVVKTSKAFLILREIKLYNQKPNRTFVTFIESFIKTNMRNQWLNFLCPDGWIFFDYRWVALYYIFDTIRNSVFCPLFRTDWFKFLDVIIWIKPCKIGGIT